METTVAGFTFLLQTIGCWLQGLEPDLASLQEFRSLSASLGIPEGGPGKPDRLQIDHKLSGPLILNKHTLVFCEFHYAILKLVTVKNQLYRCL